MIALDASIGGAASNSYVTLVEANAYFEASYGKTSWTDSVPVDDVKNQLLISATQILDTYFKWTGVPTSETQALAWPQRGAYDRNGLLYADDIIPQTLKIAVYELAYHLLANGGLNFSESKIDEVKVGSIGVKFNKYVVETGIPETIQAILTGLGVSLYSGAGKINVVELVRR